MDRTALQLAELTKATLWNRKEILYMRKALDQLRGSS
jgi:hypothetical protein